MGRLHEEEKFENFWQVGWLWLIRLRLRRPLSSARSIFAIAALPSAPWSYQHLLTILLTLRSSSYLSFIFLNNVAPPRPRRSYLAVVRVIARLPYSDRSLSLCSPTTFSAKQSDRHNVELDVFGKFLELALVV